MINDKYVKVCANDKSYFMPLSDYLDLQSRQHGFEDYNALKACGYYIDLTETTIYTRIGGSYYEV